MQVAFFQITDPSVSCSLCGILPDVNACREHERRLSRTEAINALPLYPTEDMLWDPNLVPEEHYDGRRCLALPKLNLQFLTIRDYLLRCALALMPVW